MPFMTLKTIVFQNKKTLHFRNFDPLLSVCYLVSLWHYCDCKAFRRDWCHKTYCFQMICYDFTGFDTGFSQKK